MTDFLELSTPVVQVNGSPLSAAWLNSLIGIRIERAVCLVGRATVRFADSGYELAAQSTLGLGADVAFSMSGGAVLFSGRVVGTSLEQRNGNPPELVVTIDDAGYQLSAGTAPRTFVQMTYADVVQEMCSRLGMTADVVGTPAFSAQNEYLLQSGSDLAFLDELTQRAGCVWWVDGKKLVVRGSDDRPAPAVTLSPQKTLREFSVRASGLRPTKVSVRGWDAATQQTIVGEHSSAAVGQTPDFVADYVGAAPGKKLVKSEVVEGLHNPNTNAEASSLAASLNAQWDAAAVVARGTCMIEPTLTPMSVVKIEDAGPASGSYLISEVEHVYRHGGFSTHFVAGPLRPSGLVDTLGTTAGDPGFGVAGMCTGKVSNVADPLKVGRVKVTYNTSAGTVESAWARIVSLGGGASRGTMFQPEVNDEVLVGFEHGDSRHPVVIGGLHSNKIKMPADASLLTSSNAVAYRRITSRLGHVIELADGTATTEQHILLRLSNNTHLIRVGADKLDVTTDAGKPITVKSGESTFAIDAGGNITISGKRISIKADADVTIEGATVAVKSNGQASVEGAVVQVKSSGVAQVQASGPLALKGAIVAIN